MAERKGRDVSMEQNGKRDPLGYRASLEAEASLLWDVVYDGAKLQVSGRIPRQFFYRANMEYLVAKSKLARLGRDSREAARLEGLIRVLNETGEGVLHGPDLRDRLATLRISDDKRAGKVSGGGYY